MKRKEPFCGLLSIFVINLRGHLLHTLQGHFFHMEIKIDRFHNPIAIAEVERQCQFFGFSTRTCLISASLHCIHFSEKYAKHAIMEISATQEKSPAENLFDEYV